jgi:hypothetical protein
MSTKYTTETIDGWTPLHVLTGVMMAQRGMTLNHAVAWSIGFEIVENTAFVQAGFVTPEGPANIGMDMAMNMLGFYLGKRMNRDQPKG